MIRFRPLATGFFFVSAGAALTAASGQPCRSCRIRIDSLVTLSRINGDPGFSSDPYSVARDSKGRYIVVTPWGRTREPPFVFDSNGVFLTRIGRTGSGPNEYQQPIKVLVGRADSMIVLDQRLARVTILAPDLRYARSFTAGEYREGTQLANGDFIVQSELGSMAFMRLSPKGDRVAQWPDSIQACGGGGSCWHGRARAWFPAADSGFWSLRRTQFYEVVYRDRMGVTRQVLRPRSALFGPYDSIANPSKGIAPQATFVGIWQDTAKRLWIVGNTADVQWQQAKWAVNTVEGQKTARPVNADALLDGFIEVLDPRTGTILASQRFPQRFAGVAAAGYVYSVNQDPDGFRQVIVSAVSLLTPSAR
jgi:hypothetical protein